MPKHCLLIEDGTEDALQVKRYLSKEGDFDLAWVTDSGEAMRYLRQEEGFRGAPSPDLLLLDLKLPGMDGLTFLEWFRNEAPRPRTPVMVVTVSPVPEDMWRAERLGVRSYLTKPVNWTRFGEEIKLITEPAPVVKQPAASRRLTCVISFFDGGTVTVSAAAKFEGQEVAFRYDGDTSLFRPFAAKGTLGFFRWYMEGIATNIGAEIKFSEEAF